MLRHIAGHDRTGHVITIAFGKIDRDIQRFFIRSNTDLTGVNGKTRVAAIEIIATDGLKIRRHFLLLVFLIANHVPPRNAVAKLQLVQQCFCAKGLVANNINLRNFCRYPLLKDKG